MAESLTNGKGSRHVLKGGYGQKTRQHRSTMQKLVSTLVTLAHQGKIQAEIGVGMPHTQHGSIRDES